MSRGDMADIVAAAILARDRRCVASRPELGFPHVCRTRNGRIHPATAVDYLELDHIQDGYGRMADRAPSNVWHLVALCGLAHHGGWATAHRGELRDYIARANASPPPYWRERFGHLLAAPAITRR